MSSESLVLSQTPAYTARLWIQATESHGVPVYYPAFIGTHCVYPCRGGQAEFTGMASHKCRYTVHRHSIIAALTNPNIELLTGSLVR